MAAVLKPRGSLSRLSGPRLKPRVTQKQGHGFVRHYLGAVVSAFVGGFPGNGGEGTLKEGVVDDVALVIFAFDDPVAGKGFAMAGVGEDDGVLVALCGVYEHGSAGAKGVHFNSPCGVVKPTISIFPLRS